jgi:hypothetical protein
VAGVPVVTGVRVVGSVRGVRRVRGGELGVLGVARLRGGRRVVRVVLVGRVLVGLVLGGLVLGGLVARVHVVAVVAGVGVAHGVCPRWAVVSRFGAAGIGIVIGIWCPACGFGAALGFGLRALGFFLAALGFARAGFVTGRASRAPCAACSELVVSAVAGFAACVVSPGIAMPAVSCISWPARALSAAAAALAAPWPACAPPVALPYAKPVISPVRSSCVITAP